MTNSGGNEPTTVRGHIALSGHCPYCGTLQTEHVVTNDFVRNGGVLDFTCMKCLCRFRVNWMGADDIPEIGLYVPT